MDVNFEYSKPGSVQPIVFEQIYGEKPGGGRVANPDFNVPLGTAVGLDNGLHKPIKAYRLVKAVAADDTTVEVKKGSGAKVGDFIATGKKAVAITAVDTSDATKDVLTATLGVAVPVGTVLYQAKAASASTAEPIYTPKYLTGAIVEAGKGDQLVKLVNGANVRKETVNASPEVLALLKNIDTV
jgi:hypothetical protein